MLFITNTYLRETMTHIIVLISLRAMLLAYVGRGRWRVGKLLWMVINSFNHIRIAYYRIFSLFLCYWTKKNDALPLLGKHYEQFSFFLVFLPWYEQITLSFFKMLGSGWILSIVFVFCIADIIFSNISVTAIFFYYYFALRNGTRSEKAAQSINSLLSFLPSL